MSFHLAPLFTLLQGILPNRVSYGTNLQDPLVHHLYPFIVYQELSNRASTYADDQATVRIHTIQISLITEQKEPALEERFEEALYLGGYHFQMVIEYVSEDQAIHRIYEIKMEEIIHE